VVLQSLGLHLEALASFEKALSLRGDAPTWNATGHQLFHAGRLEEALHAFDQAIAVDPNLSEAHCNRGSTLIRLNRFSEALQSCERAAALTPQNAAAHDYCGVALTQLGRYEDALQWHDRAIALSPNEAALHSNRAATLVRLERTEEALASSERAIALAPELADAHVNRGFALTKLGRHAIALQAYEQGLTLEPDLADAHLGRGYTLQLLGDLREGWKEFDFRWKQPFAEANRHSNIPAWRGDTPLAGKRILLWSEQGFGDTLQFCRYAPLVAGLGTQVILEVQPSHRELLRRLDGVSGVFAQGEPLPPCDAQAPLMDLPLAFDTGLETIPAGVPYLSADPALVDRWWQRLGHACGPRIGLVCSGNPRHKNDASRSIRLEQVLPLTDIGDWTLLQREVRPADEPALGAGKIRDLRHELTDFAQAAAVVACMDLIISVDTAAAHLAGAMGKPVWILLPYVPDCRWLLERADSPWYPTARLFRQEALNEWSGVIARVRAALEQWSSMASRSASMTTVQSPGTG
jgi:Flp pilus assembly protein TadD